MGKLTLASCCGGTLLGVKLAVNPMTNLFLMQMVSSISSLCPKLRHGCSCNLVEFKCWSRRTMNSMPIRLNIWRYLLFYRFSNVFNCVSVQYVNKANWEAQGAVLCVKGGTAPCQDNSCYRFCCWHRFLYRSKTSRFLIDSNSVKPWLTLRILSFLKESEISNIKNACLKRIFTTP